MREIVKDDFDEISPITGERMVLVEDNLRMDLSSGYQNMFNIWMADDPKSLEQPEENLPGFILKFKFVDETNNVWYPMMSYSDKAIIFPIEGDGDLIWAVHKVEKVSDKNDINTNFVFAIPVKVNDKIEQVLYKIANDPEKLFEKRAFEDAFDYYNSICND